MKQFDELRKDYVQDPELQAVLNGCASMDDIKNGFAEKGYKVTDSDIEGFLKEKLPAILEAYPKLEEQIKPVEDEDLNGMETGDAVKTIGLNTAALFFAGTAVGGPIGAAVGTVLGLGKGILGVCTDNPC